MVGTALRQFIPLVPLAFLFGKLGGVGSMALAVLFSVLCTRRKFRRKVTPLCDTAVRF